LNTTDKIIKHKTGLLNLAEELGNVSKACQVMGMSRDTFYRYKSAVEGGGVEALFERTRRKPNLANRVDQATEDAVIKSATDFPAYGQARTSNELRKLGVFVEKRAKVGDALRGGISRRCSDAVNSLLRKGYATCRRLPLPRCQIHPGFRRTR
jgi:hypothetical protein